VIFLGLVKEDSHGIVDAAAFQWVACVIEEYDFELVVHDRARIPLAEDELVTKRVLGSEAFPSWGDIVNSQDHNVIVHVVDDDDAVLGTQRTSGVPGANPVLACPIIRPALMKAQRVLFDLEVRPVGRLRGHLTCT
jgi:hypothetical protein